jgi:hypothetical protein
MKMKFRKPNPLVYAGILFLLISVIVASKLYVSGHTYHIYAAILELCLDGLIFGCIVVFLQERQKAKQVKESKDMTPDVNSGHETLSHAATCLT